MKHQICVFAMLVALLPLARTEGNRNTASPKLTSTGAVSAGSPIPTGIHPAFLVSETQLRKAFDDAELRGEKQQGMNAGEIQVMNIMAQNPLGGTETLQLRILFTTPLDQVAIRGYSFGLVAKTRTPADRKAYEDLSIKRVMNNMSQAIFHVFLQQPKNSDASIPGIHFKLLDHNGSVIDPLDEPTSYLAPDKDPIGAVALEQDGQPLTFPNTINGLPAITAEMTKLTLTVMVDGQPGKLNFKLP